MTSPPFATHGATYGNDFDDWPQPSQDVFQVRGIDSLWNILVCCRLRRSEVLRFFETLPPRLVGMEVCGTSHYWAHSIATFGRTIEMMPQHARKLFQNIVAHLRALEQRIADIEKQIVAEHRANSVRHRLSDIPGIGPITAARSLRLFQMPRLFGQAGISQQGDSYLRHQLVLGATTVIRLAHKENDSRQWAAKLFEKKAARVVSVALANKTAQIIWTAFHDRQWI